jgi:protease-4
VDKSKPLEEYTLQGSASEKILVIPIDGMITDHGDFSILSEKPGMVENVVSQLRLAAADDRIKAVLLKIDSPGGLTTASGILYHEISEFKKKTGKTIVVSMLDMATSGAYMIALPADVITAHPTTVTGSVGVIFMRPDISGLLGKIGVSVDVTKSGRDKDMGSPFRRATPDERKAMQSIIDKLNGQFLSVVKERRNLSADAVRQVSTARVFLADEALALGLIDKICYLDGALAECRRLCKLPSDARVVAYRRIHYHNDNIYNSSTSRYDGGGTSAFDPGILKLMGSASGGFHSVWPVAVGAR